MIVFKKNILILLCLSFAASCMEDKSGEQPPDNIANNNVKNIIDVETNLASAPGEEIFKSNCITCHSLQYIQMQPSFPRKTWEKEVSKMIKSFGAPISDSSAKVIVEYLVAVKGTEHKDIPDDAK